MSFSVRKSGQVSQLRSQAFIAHARVGAGLYVIAAILVVAILPTVKLPQVLAILLLVPLIWNQWWARGWFLAFDDGGLTEVLRREEGIALRWETLAGFAVAERPAPSNLSFLGRGDGKTCFVVEALPAGGGEPQLLWATAGYGTSPVQPDALDDAESIAEFLEARRVEATATPPVTGD
ncbi:MAG: hypothetical protein REI11_04140 [Patulibacter sp.]|nr:hypothetical protein [Patulibacter sp.]